jgi:hypothetical protein
LKDLLIGILLGILATLLCLGLIWCKRLDAQKVDKHKIIQVQNDNRVFYRF